MSIKRLITINGLNKLVSELDHLQKVEMPIIIKAISEGRAHGDLSENAEYQSAKEKQHYLEAKIGQLQTVIDSCQVVDLSKIDKSGKVVFGCFVKLIDISENKEKVFQLLGEDESDLMSGKLSITSPIGKALSNKTKGDFIVVTVPSGEKEYEILDVFYE